MPIQSLVRSVSGRYMVGYKVFSGELKNKNRHLLSAYSIENMGLWHIKVFNQSPDAMYMPFLSILNDLDAQSISRDISM